MNYGQKKLLLSEIEKLHNRYELSKNITPGYFEPDMMEYLDKFEGFFDEKTGEILIRFEAIGTQHGSRTELIESLEVGEPVVIIRDPENKINSNNFYLTVRKGKDVGNMPQDLCDVIAPLFDSKDLIFESVNISFVDPISKRSRHASRAILFAELHARLTNC